MESTAQVRISYKILRCEGNSLTYIDVSIILLWTAQVKVPVQFQEGMSATYFYDYVDYLNGILSM